MLGPLCVEVGGSGPLELGPYKWRLVLATLLTRPNAPVSGDLLAEVLWGDEPPPSAAGTLRVYVHQLRQILGRDRILRAPGGYRLVVAPGETDADRFRGLAAQAREAAAGELFRKALALWRGPAFADLRDHPVIQAAAAALDEARLNVLEECAAAELAVGRHAELCAELGALAAEHPLRENLTAHLMTALARSGRQAEATVVFHQTRRLLADEFGLDPGPRLHELHQQILAGASARLRPGTPLQLPRDTAEFAGRAGLLAALDAHLPAGVTVVAGMAGVGKTTLVAHWAHRLVGRFPDGQLFVNLRGFGPGTPVRPIDALASMLRGLGVAAEAVPLEVEEASALYRTVLADRRVLVVLDNAGSAEQVRPLLPGGGGCHVVVTSRHRLSGLAVQDGARRLDVDVLAPAEASALLATLLRDRRGADPAASVQVLARVCGYLPLALRIVAAQLLDAPFRGVAEQAELLRARGLRSMTVDGERDAVIRAAFDASYASLTTDVRRMFRLLGLLPTGDIPTTAAAVLAGAPVAEAALLLDRLTAGFLLTNPAAGRYTLHDLLRWYAAEHAADDPDGPAAFQRVCDWYLHSVDAAAQHLHRHSLRLPLWPEEAPAGVMRFETGAAARAWLEEERANLVALVGHCAEHGPRRTAWLLADALRGIFDRLRHIVDWTATTDAGLAAARAEDDRRAVVAMLHSAAHSNYVMGRYPAAETYLGEATELAREDGWAMAEAALTANLGIVHREVGRLIAAGTVMKRAIGLSEESGLLHVNLANNLCLIQIRLGQLRQALRTGLRSLDLGLRTGNLSSQATALHSLGWVYWELGRPERAAEHFARSVALAHELGFRDAEIRANLRLALVEALHHGRPGDGLPRAETALETAVRIADRNAETEAAITVAAIHVHLGDFGTALRRYERAASVADAMGIRPYAVEAVLGTAVAHRGLGDLDTAERRAEAARAEAASMSMAVYTARAVLVLAEIALLRGDHATAAAHARHARRACVHTGHRPGEEHARAVLAAVRGLTQQTPNKVPTAP
ncbi:BTAD domain-containing putative transcriptional regulator [Dactylosporangium sp. CS-047395]|uniref:AfsR/SARP family transcriptional regulator n=1 Tax=Dactylosporangium sp. CS-047395 TaxID=3239936 RepID=UPI003D93BED1